MDSKLIYAFVLTLLAGLSTSIGSAVVLFSKRFSSKFLAASLGFSAGVMIFISLVELFNDSKMRLGAIYGDKLGFLYAWIALFGGIAVIAIIDNMVPSYENPHEVGE